MSVAVKHRFQAIDAFRGIFAVLIVLYHFSAYGYFYDLPFVRNAHRGVDFFFMLSGFVITSAYLDKIRDQPNFVDFSVKRLGRLWPLHITMLGALVVLEFTKLAAVKVAYVSSGQWPFHGTNSIPALLGNIFLLNGIGIFKDFTWNGPSWSISTELFAYLLFYACALTGKSYRLMALGLAVGAGAAMIWLRLPPRDLSVAQGYGFISCIFYFMAGSLLFLGFRSWTLKAAPWMEWFAVGLLVTLFCVDFPTLPLLMPLVFGFSIWVFANQSGVLSRFMTTAVPQYLGRTSYSIYLIHYVAIQFLMAAVRVADKKLNLHAFKTTPSGAEVFEIGNRLTMDLLAVALLAAVIATAGLTYRFIEQPGQRFARDLGQRLRPSHGKGKRRITWIG